MLHTDDKRVKNLLLQGNFGLEKESLRVLRNGSFSHTPHPFPLSETHIVRDFCENQTEINTSVYDSADGAVDALLRYTRKVNETIARLPEPEILWQFSNPPFIEDEDDVPTASFTGVLSPKTSYREYLSRRYGKYKMALCGIHVNYSFSDELLRADFEAGDETDFQEYKNRLYLTLAEQLAAYGWILTAITAASPLFDSSYVEEGVMGRTTFNGFASLRCGELGYWNYFTPVFNYASVETYADSIQRYVDEQLLAAPTELYYPIRLKPRGQNLLQTLREEGVNHIELRMFDLNPLEPSGVNKKDLVFAQLLMVWLLSMSRPKLTVRDQVQAVQNFKNAARYDLRMVNVGAPNKIFESVENAALKMIIAMKNFYRDFPPEIRDILDFEAEKFVDPDCRYAWIIRNDYADNYVGKGIRLAKERQEELLNVRTASDLK